MPDPVFRAVLVTGVRVLDMTRVLAGLRGTRRHDILSHDGVFVCAGPSCTQVLGDLGAKVTKIERPEVGDDTRGFAPPFLPGATEDNLILREPLKSFCWTPSLANLS